MYTDSEMSFFTERSYTIVYFKEVRIFLFIHSERTPLPPVEYPVTSKLMTSQVVKKVWPLSVLKCPLGAQKVKGLKY